MLQWLCMDVNYYKEAAQKSLVNLLVATAAMLAWVNIRYLLLAFPDTLATFVDFDIFIFPICVLLVLIFCARTIFYKNAELRLKQRGRQSGGSKINGQTSVKEKPSTGKKLLVGIIIFIVVATVAGGIVPIFFSSSPFAINTFMMFVGTMIVPFVLMATLVVAIARATAPSKKPKK